ncbi:HNH endonuclease [Guptibacillus spartinae]|uniref:HNH endonuclease n=1 Tax=Guptibacillus spartinae TaxID=3025679 RepID=UPI002361DDEF|nr:HNH endonuclease signature motif containing protein [Pseudalkalibacillus spartinae]
MDNNPFDSTDTVRFSRNRKIQDIYELANILKRVELENNELRIGNFILQGRRGITKPLHFSHKEDQHLDQEHNYTFTILEGDLELSLQLNENGNHHYRINSFSRINDLVGPILSMNLTTEKDAKGCIFLNQKIKFSERYAVSGERAKKHREMKREVFCSMLTKLGFEISESYDLLLGVYDTRSKSFLNTTPEKFVKDFLMITILKGHFMGNKGYELEILPSYSLSPEKEAPEQTNEMLLPERIKNQKLSRSIPLGLRFKVLERDRVCMLCGRSPKDDIILHVDHIVPFSLGGLTVLENLQALCNECNIGKSNRSQTKY